MKRLLFFFCLCAVFGCSKIPDVPAQNIELVTYPNPASNQIDVYVKNSAGVDFTLKVFDPGASLIFEESVSAKENKNLFRIDLTQKQKGRYHVLLKMSGFVHARTFVVI